MAAAALVGAAPAPSPVAGSVPPVAGVAAAPAPPEGAIAPGPATAPAPAAPAALPQPPGKTTLVSVSRSKTSGAGASAMSAISATGRYVAFASQASDLVRGTTAAASSVYLRDRVAGTTIRLPLAAGGPPAAGSFATEPSISADGSVVAFTVRETQDPASRGSSVEVWRRSAGSTALVSNPIDAQDASYQPSVSANGQFVAFASTAPRIVPGHANHYADVYRFQIATGQTLLVSSGSGERGYVVGDSSAPSISGDGSLVAFASAGGTSLMPSAVGPGQQVYLRDMNTGVISELSAGPGGAAPDNESAQPAISDDGLWVAFTSAASNLVAAGGPTTPEVYRRDVAAGQTALASARDDGTPYPTSASGPGISRDGRMVAFVVSGKGVAGAILAARQASVIVLRDMTAQQSALITVSPNGALSPSYSAYPAVGGNGRFVTFTSNGADLVSGDSNTAADVFIRDLPPVPRLSPPAVDFGTRAVGVTPSSAAAVLSNGGWGPMAVRPAALAGANPGDFAILLDGCSGSTLHRGEACTVTVGFAPTQAGARTAQLQVPADAPGSPAVQRLTGNGSQTAVTLSPPVGPPGVVVVVTGDHFPPDSEAQLSWDTGISPSLPVIKADAQGHWQAQVLVFHNDIVGPRNLVVAWVGGPEFPSLTVPMLVTMPSAMPPGFDLGGPPDRPLSLLFRG